MPTVELSEDELGTIVSALYEAQNSPYVDDTDDYTELYKRLENEFVETVEA